MSSIACGNRVGRRGNIGAMTRIGRCAVAVGLVCGCGWLPDKLEPSGGPQLDGTTELGMTGASTSAATAIEVPETTGTGSSGGSGSSDGTAGTTGPGGGTFCQEACSVDEDCDLGYPMGFVCFAGRCRGDLCALDGECMMKFSGWENVCENDSQCANNEACVDVGLGIGRCAPEPVPISPCDIWGTSEELMLPRFDGGGLVAVCGTDEYTCDAGVCANPCTHDGECVEWDHPGQPICDLDSGRCVCTSDEDCTGTGKPGFTACLDGACGCVSDADCEWPGEVCFDGRCGCTSVDACPKSTVFDGTTVVCAEEP